MAPIPLQNAETTALPLTEQITDLCDYCVNLTEAMVKFEEMSDNSIYRYQGPQHLPGAGVCRLCKVLAKQLSAQEQQLRFVTMDQIYNGGKRPNGPDSVNPRRICGVTIHRRKHVVWADKGSKQVVPYFSVC